MLIDPVSRGEQRPQFWRGGAEKVPVKSERERPSDLRNRQTFPHTIRKRAAASNTLYLNMIIGKRRSLGALRVSFENTHVQHALPAFSATLHFRHNGINIIGVFDRMPNAALHLLHDVQPRDLTALLKPKAAGYVNRLKRCSVVYR